MTTEQASASAALVRLGRALTATHHEIVHRAADLQVSGEWQRMATSAARWIAEALDVHLGTAREWIRIGLALRHLPLIEQGFADGSLSYAKVRTLTRIATPDNEGALLPIAEAETAQGLGRALAHWSNQNEPSPTRDARHHRDRKVSWWVQPDGMIAGLFRLPPLLGGHVTAAIEATVTARASRPRDGASADAPRLPSLGQQRADALVDVITGGGTAITTEVVLHVRGDGCSLDDGTPITESAAARQVPTSLIRALIHDAEGRPVNASSRRRHPSSRQKRVVRERDGACVDCGSTELLEYDHVPEYATSGHTVMDELALRCAPCHRRRHRDAA